MAITYTDRLATLGPEQLLGFFVGWPNPPSPEAHLEILRRSYAVWLAFDEEGFCVGFINAISDGVFYASIPLLEVLPTYQHQGIGAELVRRMLQTLDPMYAIDVVCDESIAPFYETLGMHRCVGMVKRNFAHQDASGREP